MIQCPFCESVEFKELGSLGENIFLRCIACGMDIRKPASEIRDEEFDPDD